MISDIKNIIKILINKILIFFLKFDFLAKIFSIINSLDNYEAKKVFGNKIYLIKKNYITKYRNDTILTKEPETINWIQGMERNSIFYDVGANIGLYSIISAILYSKKVIAFEPSFFNLQLLSKNIYKNNLSEKIIIVPISLDSNTGQGLFKLSSIEEGGALSSFEYNDVKLDMYNDSQFINKKIDFKYSTISFSLDEFLKNFNELKPDYLKIDVDGIETKILKGGTKILENHVKSILIKSNSSADEKEIIKIMNFYNFQLMDNKSESYNLIFNKF